MFVFAIVIDNGSFNHGGAKDVACVCVRCWQRGHCKSEHVNCVPIDSKESSVVKVYGAEEECCRAVGDHTWAFIADD